MSIIWSNSVGYFLCHNLYLQEIYNNLKGEERCTSCMKYKIFHINSQFLRSGQKRTYVTTNNYKIQNANDQSAQTKFNSKLTEINKVTLNFSIFIEELNRQQLNYFQKKCELNENNSLAINAANRFFEETKCIKDIDIFHGGNINSIPVEITYNNVRYIIPPQCSFYCCDVNEIDKKILNLEKNPFDVIVLDPPWWNKYVRRKNANCVKKGYNLMHKNDLVNIPVNKLLSCDGLVVVWCTNSQQQINFLIEEIFPAWKICYVATWYWIKVTENCQPICEFSLHVSRKQPFERIVFGTRVGRSEKYKNPELDKLIVSVPSSVHSHKPPLINVLAEYIPLNSNCLELFARYLLPRWTSCGNEVLKLQHPSLYK